MGMGRGKVWDNAVFAAADVPDIGLAFFLRTLRGVPTAPAGLVEKKMVDLSFSGFALARPESCLVLSPLTPTPEPLGERRRERSGTLFVFGVSRTLLGTLLGRLGALLGRR